MSSLFVTCVTSKLPYSADITQQTIYLIRSYSLIRFRTRMSLISYSLYSRWPLPESPAYLPNWTEPASFLFSLIRLCLLSSQIPGGEYLFSHVPVLLLSDVRSGYSYVLRGIPNTYLRQPTYGNVNRATVPTANYYMPNADNRPNVSLKNRN